MFGKDLLMELRKIAVKFFAEDPGAVRLAEFIPILHRWIQERKVEGTLIERLGEK